MKKNQIILKGNSHRNLELRKVKRHFLKQKNYKKIIKNRNSERTNKNK